MSTLLCLTSNPDIAAGILDELQACGRPQADLSLIAATAPKPKPHRDYWGAPSAHMHAPGAATGVVTAHTLATRAGTVTLTIPGLGPFLASGPLAASFRISRDGSARVDLADILHALGMIEVDAARWSDLIRDGLIMIAVHRLGDGDAHHLTRIVRQEGGHNVTHVTDPR